jgi:DNA-directed RNA polymerase sigma subunit (sigma70/sigma32)
MVRQKKTRLHREHPMTPLQLQFQQQRHAIADALRATPVRTYEQIGAEFGITRERVRQIAKRYGLRRKADAPAPTDHP